jgi:hypothetical protein
VNQSNAEDLEWARLRVVVATERAATADHARYRSPSSARHAYEAESELRRARLCLRAQAAQAFRSNANPLFWHDRFGRPRDMAERAYQLSA